MNEGNQFPDTLDAQLIFDGLIAFIWKSKLGFMFKNFVAGNYLLNDLDFD